MEVCPQCAASVPQGSEQCPHCRAAITAVEQGALDPVAETAAEPALAVPGSLGALGGARRVRAALNLALGALLLLVSVPAWQAFVHSPWGARLGAMNEIVFVGTQNLSFAATGISVSSGCVAWSASPGLIQQRPAGTGRCSGIYPAQDSAGSALAAAAPQLYVMRPDGSGLHRLTSQADADYFSPVWSPDGAQIAAFVVSADAGGAAHLVVMDAAGSNARQIPAVEFPLALFSQPSPSGFSSGSRLIAWSPDGTQLVAPTGIEQYALVNADGTNLRVFSGLHPTWSPDGRYLAYFVKAAAADEPQAQGPQQYNIELLDTRTARTRQLSNVPLLNTEALAWSPDGRYLAYSALGDGSLSVPSEAVMLVRPNGSAPRQVAQWATALVRQIVWSPDSAKLAVVLQNFEVNQLGNARADKALDIWVVNADSSNDHAVGFSADGQPSWAPDGKRLVYTSADATALLIADTSTLPRAPVRVIALSPVLGLAPCWSPLAGI